MGQLKDIIKLSNVITYKLLKDNWGIQCSTCGDYSKDFNNFYMLYFKTICNGKNN